MAGQLHEAAAKGVIDVIAKIGKDIEIRTSINEKDRDKDTPVLKAVRNAQIEAVAALVAFGADVNITDTNGKTPIRIAFENKSLAIVQLLCSIGAHVNLSDWFMELQLINTLERHDREMLLMVKTQTDKMSGFQHKLIKSKIVYVESGQSVYIEELGITIEPTLNHNILLRCMQMIPEYADFYVPPNHCFFGEIFEFQAWNITNVTIQVNLTFPDIPQPNERLSVFPLEGRARENHSLTFIDKFKKLTRLTIDIDLKKWKTVRFGVLATEFQEIFDVPKNGTTITPQMEPESYINIKPDTFQTDVQMTVSDDKITCHTLTFTGTKMWNDDDSSKSDFLITNVLNVTSSVDLQPSKDMEIMLPLHTVPANSVRVAILVSDKTQPEVDSDWQEKSPQVAVTRDNKVKFHIGAFKWCVAALSDAIDAATRNANLAIKGEKMINIFAMLKREQTFHELVVEFSLHKHLEKNKKTLLRSGYSFECEKKATLCRNKPYKISFSGNIDVVQQENTIHHLIFDMRKERIFRTFQVKGSEHNAPPTGQVYIGKPVMSQTIPKSIIERFLDFFKKNKFNESIYTFQDLLFLDIGVKEKRTEGVTEDCGPQRPVKPVYKYIEAHDDPDDVQCSYAVLRKSSLYRLGQLLTKDEYMELRKVLHVSDEQMQDIQNDRNVGGLILCLWRVQRRPNPGMVSILAQALKKIQREDLAVILETALDRRTEVNFIFE